MPATVYSRSLPLQTSSAAQYHYAFAFPAVTAGGAYVRPTFIAGSQGPLRLKNAYFGVKASTGDLAFAPGRSAQLTFNGNGESPEIPAGTLFAADPIALAISTGERFVLRYDFDPQGGAFGYAYETGLSAADFDGGYKSGLGGAANGNDVVTGFSSYGSPATGTLVKLEVANSLADFDANGASVFGYDAMMLNNQLAAAAKEIAGVAGKRLHVFLRAPTSSDVIGVLETVAIHPDADTLVSVQADAPVASMTEIPRCNTRLGSLVAPKCEPYYHYADHVRGYQHDLYRLKGGESKTLQLKWPLATVPADSNFGVSIVLHEPGVGATVGLHWREMPV